MAPVQDGMESDASMRARLVESLSNSFPGSALSKALHFMDTDDVVGGDHRLSSSCFAELRLDRGSGAGDVTPDEIDDELTNLEWLQNHDLLKNIETGDRSLCTSPIDDVQKENDVLGSRSHPPHVPYNPQKHVTSKPPYSFSCLIFMAIEESPTKKLPVKDIYDWIQVNFPYFRNAPTGWKNSVRHNLSLNKCFMKVEKDRGQGIGKGSYWCVDPNFRPNLLQALRRTPYHPYHQMQMVSSAANTHANNQNQGLKNSFNEPSPHLFPFLSQRLAQTKVADSSDIDVANALVQLKRSACGRRPLHCKNSWDGGSRSPSPSEFSLEMEKRLLRRKLRASRCRSPVVCTSNPSTDHTYSLTDDQIQEALLLSPSSSSVDEDYNFISDVDDVDGEFDDHFDDEDDDEEDDLVDSPPRGVVTKTCTEDAGHRMPIENGQQKENEPNVERKTIVIPPKNNIITRSMTCSLRRKCPTDLEDEEKKIREGADALLNLAGFGSLSIMQQEAEKSKKRTTSVAKTRSGLRIRLKKRACRKPAPRDKTTCNKTTSSGDGRRANKKSNNNVKNNNGKSNRKVNSDGVNNNSLKRDHDDGSVQIKTEPDDYSSVQIKEEKMDDDDE